MPTLIQSAQRALAIIEFLNAHNGASVSEVCEEFELARGTGYRLLETLRREGYVLKEEGSQSYWLAGRVLALSSGYAGEFWIERFARPLIVALGQKLQWPIRMTTRRGNSILVRISTDYLSHLTFTKKASGLQVGIFSTASGAIYQTFDKSGEMRTLCTKARDAGDRQPLGEDEKQDIRAAGYLLRNSADTAILAVPVCKDDRIFACLTLEYFRRIIPQSAALDDFLPELQAAAKTIGEQVTDLDVMRLLDEH